MPITFNDRLEMLQVAAHAWLGLTKLLKTIPDARLEEPNTIGTWSGRDLLVHLANWDEEAIDALHRYASGEEFQWPTIPDEDLDRWNEEHLAPWRSRSLDDVKQYLERTHFALLDLAEKQPDVRPRVVVGVTEGHYGEHMDDLRSLLAGRN
jgi:hypothetical protein